MQISSDTLTKSVRDALDARLKGEQAPFEYLVLKLRQASVDGTPARLLKALTVCAPTLAQEPEVFKPIIDEVLNSPMAHLVEGVRHANTAQSFEQAAQKAREAMRPLLNFLAGLVSVNSALLPSVFHSIAQKLLPREGDGSEDSDDEDSEDDEDESNASNSGAANPGSAAPHLTVRRLRRRARPWEREEPRIEGLYGCTHSLLMLVPTGLPALFEALRASFPHRRHGVHTHRAYTRRLLRLAQALPALEDRLLSIVIDRMVDIDVEISIRDVDEQEEAARARAGSHDGTDGGVAVAHIETLADKLDVMIELVFQYLDEKCGADAGVAGVGCAEQHLPNSAVDLPGASQPGGAVVPAGGRHSSHSGSSTKGAQGNQKELLTRRRKHALALILAVFERSVLPTYKSRFTQFIVFYLCRLSASMADTFTGRMINNLRNRTLPMVIRVACASYVGSFLARAKFVDDSTVRSALFYLLGYAHRFLDESEQRQLAESARAANATGGVGGRMRIGPDGESIRVSPGARGGSGQRLYSPTVFLAVCQACFYIVAFRARSLAQSPEALDFLRQLRFGRVVSSREDPLRRCLDSVSREFVRVAINLQLVTDREVRQSVAGPSLLVLPEDSLVSEDDDDDDDEDSDGGSSGSGEGSDSEDSGSENDSSDDEGEDEGNNKAHGQIHPSRIQPQNAQQRSGVHAMGPQRQASITSSPIVPLDMDGTSTGSGVSRRSGSSGSAGQDVAGGALMLGHDDHRSVSAAPAPGKDSDIAVRLIQFRSDSGSSMAASSRAELRTERSTTPTGREAVRSHGGNGARLGIGGKGGAPAPSSSSSMASQTQSLEQLKEYFPFDPFRLRRSRHFLKGLYRKWEDVELRDEDLPEDLREALYAGMEDAASHAYASDEGGMDDEDEDGEEDETPHRGAMHRRGSIGSASSAGSARSKGQHSRRIRSESMAGGVGFSLQEDEEDLSESSGGTPVAARAAAKALAEARGKGTGHASASGSARADRRAGSHASHSGAESLSAAELSADMAKEAEGLGRVGRTLDQLGHSQATYTEAMRSRIAEMGGLEHVDPLSDLDSGVASGSAAEDMNGGSQGRAAASSGGGEVMYELGGAGVTVDELGLGSHSADKAAMLSAHLEGVTGGVLRADARAGQASGRSAGGGATNRQRVEERMARAARRQQVVRQALAEEDSDGRSLEPSPLLGPAGSPLSIPAGSPGLKAGSAAASRHGGGGGALPPLRIEAAAAGMARTEEGESGYRRASMTGAWPSGAAGSSSGAMASSKNGAVSSGAAAGTASSSAHVAAGMGLHVPGRMEADDELAVGLNQGHAYHASSKASVKSHISEPPPMHEMAWLLSASTVGASTGATSRHTSGAGIDGQAVRVPSKAGTKRPRPVPEAKAKENDGVSDAAGRSPEIRQKQKRARKD